MIFMTSIDKQDLPDFDPIYLNIVKLESAAQCG